MNVTCSICNAPNEIADAQLSSQITQTVCQNCGSNLVFMRNYQGLETKDLSAPVNQSLQSRSPSLLRYKRANLLGIVSAAAFCLINAVLASSLLIVVFLLTIRSPLWEKSPAAAAFKERTVLKGIHLFRSVLAFAPSSASAQVWRGMAAEVIGDFDEASHSYRAAARLEPSPEHSFLLGVFVERMGDTSLAVASLKASLTDDPGEKSVRAEHLFRVLIETDDREEALALAREMNWVRQGVDYCKEELDDFSEETQALLAMLIQPERADCLLPIGKSLTDGGLVRLARQVLMDRVQHSPDQKVREQAAAFLRHRLPAHSVSKLAESLNIVGYNLQFSFGLPEQAIKVYLQASVADPSFSWPYSNIGNVYKNREDNTRAIEWFRKAVTINPNHWRAQYNLGYAAFSLKRYDEALEAFLQAVALNPDDAYGHSNLGRLLLNFGEEEEAIRHLRIAMRLDPRVGDQGLLNDTAGLDPRRGPTPFSSL
jgi:tetratricopeptide (TPR) repeat protein